jgi:hypothetical protein
MSTITHIHGGADFHCVGKRTKKELKERIEADASQVYLYTTSSMGPQFSGKASDLPEDTEFNVVGPDAYAKRDWYATIKYGVKGKLIVT